MDSKIVNKEIRKVIHPLLKSNGFEKITSRNAWRHSGDRVDIINFHSFSSYHARRMGCTTFSFAVNLGCYLTFVPEASSIDQKAGRLYPQEYHCPFRSSLKRGYIEWFKRYKDIYYLDKNGKKLEKAIVDAKNQIITVALPWFNMLHDDETLLTILREKREDMHYLWGFGNNPSPHRSLLSGYIFIKLGKVEEAKEALLKAIDSGCYENIKHEIEKTINML